MDSPVVLKTIDARRWLKENGFDVKDRGRISAAFMDEYFKGHPELNTKIVVNEKGDIIKVPGGNYDPQQKESGSAAEPAAPVVQPAPPVVQPAPPVVQPAPPVVQPAPPVVQPAPRAKPSPRTKPAPVVQPAAPVVPPTSIVQPAPVVPPTPVFQPAAPVVQPAPPSPTPAPLEENQETFIDIEMYFPNPLVPSAEKRKIRIDLRV